MPLSFRFKAVKHWLSCHLTLPFSPTFCITLWTHITNASSSASPLLPHIHIPQLYSNVSKMSLDPRTCANFGFLKFHQDQLPLLIACKGEACWVVLRLTKHKGDGKGCRDIQMEGSCWDMGLQGSITWFRVGIVRKHRLQNLEEISKRWLPRIDEGKLLARIEKVQGRVNILCWNFGS